jgi:hypothetical protein
MAPELCDLRQATSRAYISNRQSGGSAEKSKSGEHSSQRNGMREGLEVAVSRHVPGKTESKLG